MALEARAGGWSHIPDRLYEEDDSLHPWWYEIEDAKSSAWWKRWWAWIKAAADWTESALTQEELEAFEDTLP